VPIIKPGKNTKIKHKNSTNKQRVNKQTKNKYGWKKQYKRGTGAKTLKKNTDLSQIGAELNLKM